MQSMSQERPKRKCQPPLMYSSGHNAPLEVNDHVRCAWPVTGAHYAGTIVRADADKDEYDVVFEDGDVATQMRLKQLVRNGTFPGEGRPLPPSKKIKSSLKKKKPVEAPKYPWVHGGFIRSVYDNSPESQGKSVAERLKFDYNISYEINKKMVPAPPERISLHDIVAGNCHMDERDLHAAALSDFLKYLLLQTPTGEKMHELIESSGVDPVRPLAPHDRDEREKIYEQHAHALAASAASEVPGGD